MLTTNEAKRTVTSDNGAAPDAKPRRRYDTGLYWPTDVRRIVRAADAHHWLRDVSLAEHNIWNWSKRGYYPIKHFRVRRRSKSLSLLGLLSVRMIAFMRSFGIPWHRIKHVYDLAADATDERYPFATRALWTDDTPRSSHIYAALDDLPAHPDASKQLSFGEYRTNTIIPAGGLLFYEGTDELEYWEPSPGVWLNPRYQSSQPCVKGSRVTTEVIKSMHHPGQDLEEILEYYEEWDTAQIEAALAWEYRLDAAEPSLAW